jgi:hypothetical protein
MLNLRRKRALSPSSAQRQKMRKRRRRLAKPVRRFLKHFDKTLNESSNHVPDFLRVAKKNIHRWADKGPGTFFLP